MDLLRHWRRRLLGGAAAAVIAPLAVLIAALAVGVGGGGIGSLGALGQAFAGPELPDAGPVAAAGGRDAAAEAGRLLARAQPPNRAAPAATQAPATAPDARRRATTPRRTGSTNPPGPGKGTPQRPSSPAPAATPQPTPQPTPSPSTVRQVGNTIHQVTDPVPVVGPPAGEVVDLIVDTAEQLPLP
jgi:hypothetical protein